MSSSKCWEYPHSFSVAQTCKINLCEIDPRPVGLTYSISLFQIDMQDQFAHLDLNATHDVGICIIRAFACRRDCHCGNLFCMQKLCGNLFCMQKLCGNLLCMQKLCDNLFCMQKLCGNLFCMQKLCGNLFCMQKLCDNLFCMQKLCGNLFCMQTLL